MRWLVLATVVGLTVIAGVWGVGVFGALSDGGFEDPDSEAVIAAERIEQEIGDQTVDLIALYSSEQLTVDDPAFQEEVEETVAAVARRPEVEEVITYYQTGAPTMVSEDGHATYVALRVIDDISPEQIEQLRDALIAPDLRTQTGGSAAIFEDISSGVSRDIVRAEMIANPILAVLLIVIFGSLVAATTPLVVGAVAILGAFAVVRLLTMVTDISVFAINIITIMGVGLAIDYALFVVSRFREELRNGQPIPQAVARTMATAGRTVTVSGITLALSLSGLLIFPQPFLRSMGLGGIAAVTVAVLATLTGLPAFLALLGHRVNALRPPMPWRRRRSPSDERTEQEGAWGRIAHSVMRRPVFYTLAVVLVLAVFALPFTRVQFGGVDERVLPENTESRVVSEVLATGFPGGDIETISVLVSGASAATADDFAEQVSVLEGVRSAQIIASRDDSFLIEVRYDGESMSQEARAAVSAIRDLPEPDGAEVLVTGSTAYLVDLLAGLEANLPWMALIVVGVTFVLLFLAFGSVVLPIKAILANILSIGASFGAVVVIFQDGRLAEVLDFTPTGYLEATQPILMLAILFGLSMDYEVFLLSRIREQWEITGDNTTAVVTGIQRTGRIITAAALLLCVVVGAFATSGITFVKMIGVGMLVAIVIDATLVRLLLVPAVMRLMGSYNWWAPSWLRGVYRRYGIHESDAVVPVERSREFESV